MGTHFKCKNLEKALRAKLKIHERVLTGGDLAKLLERYLIKNETFDLAQ